ncbi:unnamed protein product, partial [Adineta steineri]
MEILFGCTNGSFEGQGSLRTLEGAVSSAKIADFNGDKHADIAMIYLLDYGLSVILGDGTGNFGSEKRYRTTEDPNLVAVGNFNGDSLLDIIVLTLAEKVAVFVGYGNGSFSMKTSFSLSGEPMSVAVGNFNGDKYTDFAVIRSDNTSAMRPMTVSIFLAYANGTFQERILFPHGHYATAITVEDFNNDKHMDLAVTSYMHHNVIIFFGYGNGNFTEQIINLSRSGPSFTDAGDFNGDNYIDLIIVNTYTNDLSVLLNYGNGTFEKQMTVKTANYPGYLTHGILNDNNRLDIINARATDKH